MGHNERKKGLKADYTTWCSSSVKAGLSLERILNEISDPKLITKVNSTIHGFNKHCKVFSRVKKEMGVDIEEYMLSIFESFKKNIELNKYEKDVETHLLCVLVAKRKQVLLGR